MHLKFRNVNDAWYGLVRCIHTGEIPTYKTDSRNGPVLQVMEPVIVTYEHPKERVLFNKARDANCFFHVYEAMWMLAGRNDVEPLAFYASNMKNYSDDGKTLNGAYGYRWRWHRGIPEYIYNAKGNRQVNAKNKISYLDQLDLLINHFKSNSSSRRAVLQMWNVEDDLLRIDSSKDVCCNTHVYFSIREEQSSSFRVGFGRLEDDLKTDQFLDMTVCNRSNDLVWGMLGANAVHFSFLQEYMADCIGVEVGVYNQITNNLHVYESNWKPEEWLEGIEHFECYPNKWPYKLVECKENFDSGNELFVTHYGSPSWVEILEEEVAYKEPWLNNAAKPMCLAFHFHKRREYDKALTCMDMVSAPDWRRAGTEWIERRKVKWMDKNPYLESAKRRGDA